MCKERMAGRKKVYTDLQALAAKESVRRWIEGLTQGHSREHAIYESARLLFTARRLHG
jgi:hypothetical protein